MKLSSEILKYIQDETDEEEFFEIMKVCEIPPLEELFEKEFTIIKKEFVSFYKKLKIPEYVTLSLPFGLINLVELDCSDCDIETIPNDLVNLKILNCSKTEVSEIPILESLEELDCSGTSVQEIPELKNLKRLRCDYMNISIPNYLTSLEYIHYFQNGVQKFPFEIKTLRYIECSYIWISSQDLRYQNSIKEFTRRGGVINCLNEL